MKTPDGTQRRTGSAWKIICAGLCLALAGLLWLSLSISQAQQSPDIPPPFQPEELKKVPQTTWQLPQSPQVEGMNSTIVQVLKRCEIDFQGAFGDLVQGFVPGADYPMIFARDTSTLQQAASYFYPGPRLASPVEEFLRRQYDDTTKSDEDGLAAGIGAISAVIAPDRHIDKATAVSDEETHLIHAAYVYFKTAGGEAWLQQPLREQRIIDRLNAALDWLYAHRLDPGTGLIKRAHTTDWGDVKMEPAANPTDIDPARDHWTASIYDQALTYRALIELAEMNAAAANTERAGQLQQAAEALRQQARRLLWQPKQGVFRTHIHLTPLQHPFDEISMVSIANAVAVRCGLADSQQARSIFNKLERARLAAGASKPGPAIYPPYPAGTFASPQMQPGKYQNGALWDWWASWQVLAEFEAGNAGMGRMHLSQIARDWAAHPGRIFEWQTISDNRGYGPADYAGAAGTAGEAVIAGLFGVNIDRHGVELKPRLGTEPGFIRAYQPSSDRYAAYRYTPQPNMLYLDYGTDGPAPVRVGLLLPPGRHVQQLTLDGNAIPYREETVGQDTYALAEVPVGIHRLAARL